MLLCAFFATSEGLELLKEQFECFLFVAPGGIDQDHVPGVAPALVFGVATVNPGGKGAEWRISFGQFPGVWIQDGGDELADAFNGRPAHVHSGATLHVLKELVDAPHGFTLLHFPHEFLPKLPQRFAQRCELWLLWNVRLGVASEQLHEQLVYCLELASSLWGEPGVARQRQAALENVDGVGVAPHGDEVVGGCSHDTFMLLREAHSAMLSALAGASKATLAADALVDGRSRAPGALSGRLSTPMY